MSNIYLTRNAGSICNWISRKGKLLHLQFQQMVHASLLQMSLVHTVISIISLLIIYSLSYSLLFLVFSNRDLLVLITFFPYLVLLPCALVYQSVHFRNQPFSVFWHSQPKIDLIANFHCIPH